MQLLLPETVSEARRHLAEGAVPVGGATLVWAAWQRDGFPERAVSLRHVPEANTVSGTSLGGAVLLHQVDDRVPEVLRRAASSIGTGAVRRTATVGGNIIGSSLRCLLPPALVLGARATVLEPDVRETDAPESDVRETGRVDRIDLAEAVAKRRCLLALTWRAPVVSGYHKDPAEEGGAPPLVVATAVGEDEVGRRLLRVAAREGYEVYSAEVPCAAEEEPVFDALAATALSDLPAPARETVRRQVADVLRRAAAA